MSFRTTATLGPVHNFIVRFPFKSSGGGGGGVQNRVQREQIITNAVLHS